MRELTSGEETGGDFALFELCVPRGAEPPLHLHNHEDLRVYVLEGKATFCIGEERRVCRVGEFLPLPRGIEHTFVVGSNQVRLLVLVQPAGLEHLCRELSRRPALYADVESLVIAAAHFGVEITGPRPAA